MKKHQLCSPTTTYNTYPQMSTSTKGEKITGDLPISSESCNKNPVMEVKKCTCQIQEDTHVNKQTSALANHISDSELSDSKSVNTTEQFFQSLKPSRIPYSPSEDEEILKFVLKDNNIFRTSSISLWKLLERKKGDLPRTYQSLKNRFYRNIKPLILRKFRKFLTDELIKNLLIKFPELKKDLHYIPTLQDADKRIESTSKDVLKGKNICHTHCTEFSGIKKDTDDDDDDAEVENQIMENCVNIGPEDNKFSSASDEKLFNKKVPETVNAPDLRKQVSETNSNDVAEIVSSSPNELRRNTVNEEVSKSSSTAIEVVKPVNYVSDSPNVINNLKSAAVNIFHEENKSAYRFVIPINFQNLYDSNENATTNKTVKIPNIDLNIVLVNSDGKPQSNDNSESLLLKSDQPLNININVTLNGFKYSNINNQVSLNDENEILKNSVKNNCANQSEVQDLDARNEKRILKRKKPNLKKKRLLTNVGSIPSSTFTFKTLESLSTVNKARLSALLTKLKDIDQRNESYTSSNENPKSKKNCSFNSMNKKSPTKKLENAEDDMRNTVIIKTLSQRNDDEESSSLESTNCSTDDDSSYNEILEDLRRTHKVGSQAKNSESEKDCTFQSKDFNSPRKRNLLPDYDMQQKEWKKKKLELHNTFILKNNGNLENSLVCSTPQKEKDLQKTDTSSPRTNIKENNDNAEKSCKLENNDNAEKSCKLENNLKNLNHDMMDNVFFRETRSSTRRKILDKL